MARLLHDLIFRKNWLSWLVLALSLFGTLLIWHFSQKVIQFKAESKFHRSADTIQDRINTRLDSYLDSLYGSQGLFVASKSVERDEWVKYLSNKNLHQRNPGLAFYAFYEKVEEANIPAFVESLKKDQSIREIGYPEAKIDPPMTTPTAEILLAKYLYPEEPYQSLLLLNAGSVRGLRQAMFQSRDSGLPSATEIYEQAILQTPQELFSLVLAVYKNGTPVQTVLERQENVQGYLVCTLEVKDFMQKILPPDILPTAISFEIYASDFSKDEQMAMPIFYYRDPNRSKPSFHCTPFESIQKISIADQTWTVLVTSSPGYGVELFEKMVSNGIPVAGFLISVLLYLIVQTLVMTQERAVKIARSLNQNLAQSQADLSEMIQGAPDPIVSLSLSGTVEAVNPKAESISGYSKEELLGKNFAELGLLKGFYLATAVKEHALVVAGQNRAPFELEMIRKDGQKIFVEANAKYLNRSDGWRGIQVIFRDITQRKAAETALRERESILHGFFNSTAMMMGVVEILPDDILHIADNEVTASFFGAKPEAMKNQLASKLGVPKHHIQLWLKNYLKAREAGRVCTFEYLHYFSAIGPRWLQVSVCHIVDSPSSQDQFAYVAQDVTEKKRQEEVTRASEERFRTLVNNIPGVVYRCALDKDWTMQYISDNIVQLSGYEASDFISNSVRTFTSIIHPEDQGRVEEEVMKGIQNKKPYVIEYRLLHREGAIHFVYEKGRAVFNAEGAVAYLDGAIFDITDRKLLEAQLKQSQKMEMMGTLSGGVAHDLNNQLTPLLGYLDLAAQAADSALEQKPLLDLAMQSGKRCADVVKRLLDFSRPTTQTRVPIDLGVFIHELQRIIPTFVSKRVQVSIEVENPITPVLANESELQTVLINLLLNSRDAMPNGGNIYIRIKNVKPNEGILSELGCPEAVCIEVADEGAGISQENLQKIFEPFFTTKSKQKGTGLGLAMAARILKDHKGKIDVRSILGKGTSFFLHLPADSALVVSFKELGVDADIQSSQKAGKVLVVDDEDSIRHVSQLILQKLGYACLLCADGQEAIDLYQKEFKQIVFVVLDMVMPKKTGKEVLKEILAINPSARVILTSGYMPDTNPEELKQLGAKEFVQKPYSLLMIKEVVKKIMKEA